MDLQKIQIYRITHINNISHILVNGITNKNSPNANPDYVAIGDKSLIDTRTTKVVKISNGNRSESYGSITLGGFIPFYFGVRMPMLYVIQHGGNHVERATPPADIIYLVCSLINIIESNMTYYFSDGHATNNLSLFYNSSKIHEIPDIIDEQAITAEYWNSDQYIRWKKQAEFFILNDIAPENICGFLCYNVGSKQRLMEMGVDNNKIKINPQAYY